MTTADFVTPEDNELIFEPTLRFRWFVELNGEKKLQQKFGCLNNHRYYWRTIETVYQHDLILNLAKGSNE